MGTETKKTPLTELGSDKSNLKAIPGNFRACVMIDSIWHHIGKDSPHDSDAVFYCAEYGANGMQSVQIFDDQGEPQIIEGKLKKQ